MGREERTPEATAVVFEGRATSYAELNTRANRLAHHLVGLGVKPDDRVAICVERSLGIAAEICVYTNTNFVFEEL